MRSHPTPDRNLSNNPPVAYAPSVPMSVYKELGAELQAAKELSETLNAQNQQLRRQNQQLQLELQKTTESALYWQQADNRAKSAPRSSTDTRIVANQNFSSSKEGALPLLPKSAKFPAPQVIEQEQGRYRRQSLEIREISSWSLAIAIGLIMVTAFGAGYLMVRPLVSNR